MKIILVIMRTDGRIEFSVLTTTVRLYYYYTIWMSLVTGFFFLVLRLNQR